MPKALKYACALALLASPAVSRAQAPAPGSTATAQEKRAEMKKERREERKEGKGKEAHPELHAAMTALERSKKDLQKAANDYGGHKAEAIKAIDEAMKHLKLAEEYDKK